MVTREELSAFYKIIKASETDIEMIGPPNPRDVMHSSTKHVLERMQQVQPEVLKFFEPAATKLMKSGDGAQVLAAALASLSGFAKVPKPRSLLTQEEGKVTLRFLARPGRINGIGGIMNVMTELLGQQSAGRALGQSESIKDEATQMTGILVEMPSMMAMQVLEKASEKNSSLSGIRVDRPKALTLDQIMKHCPPDSSSSKGGRGGRGRGGRGRSDGRGRGGSFRSRDRADSPFDRRFDRDSSPFGRRFDRDNDRYSDYSDRRGGYSDRRGSSSRRSFDGYKSQSRRFYSNRGSRDDFW